MPDAGVRLTGSDRGRGEGRRGRERKVEQKVTDLVVIKKLKSNLQLTHLCYASQRRGERLRSREMRVKQKVIDLVFTKDLNNGS